MFAFGKSIPTSIIVVETKISYFLFKNCLKYILFQSDQFFHVKVQLYLEKFYLKIQIF